jgi:NAD(P)-dependent dehydrogenase (short-subunit alcohol dehydrogenase family)
LKFHHGLVTSSPEAKNGSPKTSLTYTRLLTKDWIQMTNKTALITGGSAGLGRALVAALSADGWQVVTDGRDAARLETLGQLPDADRITAVAGDVTHADHRDALLTAVGGRLDLLVHNASALGPVSGDTRHRLLADVTPEDLQHVWRHNVGAPLVLTSLMLPLLTASGGVLLSISSDAAVEHYSGWGLYGASKAGLDHLTLTFSAENPAITAYSVDPGDMRTRMHQDWFPGEDISDRPLPETVVPHLLALLGSRPPSGRYRAADFPALRVAERTGA